MVRLLQDIATASTEAVGSDNPLRQVIINTHSPAVVSQVQDDSLIVSESQEASRDGRQFQKVRFGYLTATWHDSGNAAGDRSNVASRAALVSYLNPLAANSAVQMIDEVSRPPRGVRRVMDRSDLQLMLPFDKMQK